MQPLTGFLGRLSIRRKLMAIIMVLSSTTMLLVGMTFIGYQVWLFRGQMASDLLAQARVLAKNCTAAVAFGRPEEVAKTLRSLNARATIQFACVRNPDGTVFAEYSREGMSQSQPPGPGPEGQLFAGSYLHVWTPISPDGNQLWRLYVRSDLSEMWTLIRKASLVLLATIFLVSLATYPLAASLQRMISTPIFALAETATAVAARKDYSLRASKLSEDEMGLLTEAFNDMLAQVQSRDDALRQSGEMLRLVLNSIPQAICWKDQSLAFMGCNQNFARMSGFDSPQELVGKTADDLPRKTVQSEHFLANEKQVMAANHAELHVIEPAVDADGKQIWLDITRAPLHDAANNVTGILVALESITERKEAEEELRQLRNLLSNIVNSMPSVLVGVDTQGAVTVWNLEAEKATGLAADQARRRPLEEVFPSLAGEMSKVSEAIASGEVQADLKVPALIDGETRYSDVTVFPLVSNGIDGAVIRVDDVTGRVRIEEIMIQSEKMLSVGGLAAGMAHEINNPLAGILQNVQVLRNRVTVGLAKNKRTAKECGTSIETIVDYMEKRGIFPMIESVMESGRRAAQIVENMLSFSRKGESRFAPYDIAELLDKTIDLASNDYDLKKKYDFRLIEIQREYNPSLPKVPCEGSKIQQVFLNLLKNGAHAMAGGYREDPGKGEKPQFFLRVQRDRDMVRVEIEDNGPGMTEQTRKRVFEPFFTTKGVGDGTGLGLSVSYFIITENHFGTMAVESAAGEGTRFIIHLPLARR